MSNLTITKTKELFEKDDVKNRLKEMLGKRSAGFVTSVLSAINSSDKLKTADPNSVYMAAMMAASLELPINANLGLAYIIPYNLRQQDGSWKVVAQFQVGYKGFMQLALRSGQFQTISAAPVYEGQLKSQDPLKGYEFEWENKTSENIIGYAAYFRLTNGFEKTLYMTADQLRTHGGKYSKTFKNKGGLWNTDFEAMARKTVIKLLLQRYAPLSIEMQKATFTDQGVVTDWENGEVNHEDNPIQDIEHEELTQDQILAKRIETMIAAAKTTNDLETLVENYTDGLPEELNEKYQQRYLELLPPEPEDK